MRLSVTQFDGSVTELRFKKGPIYIGRQQGNQVFLPDKAVSRQHAVIYADNSGSWILEDMGSANKTFVNEKAVSKHKIADSNVIQIGDFTIEVHLDEQDNDEQWPAEMDDTLVGSGYDVHAVTVVRQPDARDGKPIKMPAKRIKDFSKAVRAICKAGNVKELHKAVLEIILGQFSALEAWAALRRHSEGPMECQGGRNITTQSVRLMELVEQRAISGAMDRCRYLLMPQLPRQISGGKIRSVIIAPVLRDHKCYGAIYANNSTEHERYKPEDLDYLMLLSIHVAAALENL